MSGVSVLLAATAAGLAVLAAAQGKRVVGRARLARLSPPPGRGAERRRVPLHFGLPVARRLTSGATGMSVALVVGSVPGLLAGVLVAVGLGWALGRLEPASARRRRELLAADLPVATDLLAACLVAGAALTDAADAVSDALGGPIAEELRAATARIRLGADPVAVWRSLAAAPALGPLGRSLARATDSGAPLAETLTRMADEQRAVRRRAAYAAAQRIGVWAAAPLGLCFLPAFVLLGVIPLIAGILSRVLSF